MATITEREEARLPDADSDFHLIRIEEKILEAAGDLAPQELRSLDAIHIATVLSIRDDLAALVSYDKRLAACARALHLEVIAPARTR